MKAGILDSYWDLYWTVAAVAAYYLCAWLLVGR
jgi:hypothetical protein